MDIVDRLKQYVGFPLIGRGTRGRLIQASMRDAAAEIERLREALGAISRTTFSGSEMGEDYYRGNCDAHETCGRMARAALPALPRSPLKAGR